MTTRAVILRPMRLRHLDPMTLPVDRIRRGRDDRGLLLGSSIERTIPFVDVVGLGHTSEVLWFELDGGRREEVDVSTLADADIERLHTLLTTLWERVRAGIQDTNEEARRAQQALAALATNA